MRTSNRSTAGAFGAACAALLACAGLATAQPAETAPQEAPQAGEPEVQLPPKSANPGWLGVGLENVEVEGSTQPRVRVKQVFRGAPAGEAGILMGDIVLAIGGVRLVGGVKEMVARVQSHDEGSPVEVLIERDGNEQAFTIVLAKAPERGTLTKNQWQGKPLPALGLFDLETRQPIDLASFRGEVLVIDVWATWCGPCRASMPHMEELQKKFGERGLRIVGVSDEEPEVVQRFTDNRGLAFKTLAYDPKHTLGSEMYVASYPTYIVVDAEGLVREVFRGSADAAKIDDFVEPLLPR